MEWLFQVQNLMKILSNKITLDKLLIRYRVNNKLKQADMANLLSCTQAQYSIWERGGKPNKLRDQLIRDILK